MTGRNQVWMAVLAVAVLVAGAGLMSVLPYEDHAVTGDSRDASGMLRAASPSTYYVATSGSDGNTGTWEQPWRTVQHGLDMAGPGDTVMVRGGTYNEYLHTNTSGTDGAPITLRGYPGEAVVLDGSGLNWRYGIDIGGADHLVIQNLTVTDYIRDGLRGFGLVSWYGSTNITVRNLTFSLVGTPIKLHQGGRDILLDNITAYDYDSGGFDCGPNGPGVNLTIRNYTAIGPGNGSDTAVDGFAVESGSHVVVEDCIAAGHAGDGFDCKSDNTTLRRCIARNNSRNNIKLWGADSQLVNCLSHDSGLTNLVLETDGSYQVVNCLFASRGSYGYLATVGYNAGSETPVTMYNTIFYNDDPSMGGTTLYLGGSVNLTADHTIYYNPFREDDVIDAAFLGQTFSAADINDGSWHATSGCGEHSMYAAPGFVDAAGHVYQLTNQSPAVDAGTATLAPSRDIERRMRPQGTAWDIGPYELPAEAPSVVWVDDDYGEGTEGWQHDHYATIQAGVDGVAAGGTVHISNGTYPENVMVDTCVTLAGEDAPVVDGMGDIGLHVTADGSNLSGLVLENGSHGLYLAADHCQVSGNVMRYNGYGIYMDDATGNVVEGNVIRENG